MLQITSEQLQVLTKLAENSSQDVQYQREVQQLLADIREQNNIQHHRLWVSWVDATGKPVQGEPEGVWPTSKKLLLTKDGLPITREDVRAFVGKHTTKPTDILVSVDPVGELGWKRLEACLR